MTAPIFVQFNRMYCAEVVITRTYCAQHADVDIAIICDIPESGSLHNQQHRVPSALMVAYRYCSCHTVDIARSRFYFEPCFSRVFSSIVISLSIYNTDKQRIGTKFIAWG